MRLVPARDLVRTPWKNGGGTTAEIAVHPPEADLDSFDWRLSMADVASDGPFSGFPGVDRTLTLIEGPGLDLFIAGEARRLDSGHPICAFPGEAPTTARLLDGPIRDFNVMTRRSRLRHSVVLAEPGRRHEVAALLALDGPIAVRAETRSLILQRFDALLFEPSGTIEADGRLLIVRMERIAETCR